MNDQPIMSNVSRDTANNKKGLSALVNEDVFQLSKFEDIPSPAPSKPIGRLISWMNDGIFRIYRFENKAGQATDRSEEDQTIWVEDGASQLSRGLENIKDSVMEKVVNAVGTMKKSIGYGSDTSNFKAQNIAVHVLSRIRKKAFRYPWVAISTALVVGFLVGSLIRSSRKVLKLLK